MPSALAGSAEVESPAACRLRDFQSVIRRLDEYTPVAYWDAGDVVFQSPLRPLWQLIEANPGKLLAVREPFAHPENSAVADWTIGIEEPESRRRVFELLSSRPYLNSGFAAGNASTLLDYLREADRLRSTTLRGSSDWGDQTALNLYCHTHEGQWLEINEGWNYCLCGRPLHEVHMRADGKIASRTGTPVHVVHGNAGTLRMFPGY